MQEMCININGVGRYKDSARINAIINHPDIKRWTMMGMDGEFDVAPLLESGKAVFLGDEHGGFLVHDEGAGIWSVHTQFMKGYRGARVLELAKKSIAWMFSQTDCIALVTFCEVGNIAASTLAHAAGMAFVRKEQQAGRDGTLWCLNIKDWVRSICQLQ